MITAARLDDETRGALIARLKSLEGQARGIQRMLEDGRDCRQIIDQFAAVQAAAHAASMQTLEAFTFHCLRESPDEPEQVASQLVSLISRLTR